MTWRSCTLCTWPMKGIRDYAARRVCYGCGGHALNDSHQALIERRRRVEEQLRLKAQRVLEESERVRP